MTKSAYEQLNHHWDCDKIDSEFPGDCYDCGHYACQHTSGPASTARPLGEIRCRTVLDTDGSMCGCYEWIPLPEEP